MASSVAFNLRGAGTSELELDLYESIGGDPFFGGGITAKSVLDTLNENAKAKSILVRLNSAGGIVTEGLAIYNMLRASKAEVTCRVDGLAGSIASVIAMSGRLEMPASAYLMIHNPWGFVEGESGDLRHQADVLDSMRSQMLDIYCAKSGKSRDLIGGLMDEEKWMTGTEALAYGFCDSLIPTPVARLAAHFDLSRYRNTPRSVDAVPRALIPDAVPPPAVVPVIEPLTEAEPKTPPPAAEITTQEAADPPAANGASPMDEQVYKDKIAELETAINALKAELDGTKSACAKAEADLAEARAKFKKKGDDDDEDDDEDAEAKAAIVARVQSLTGHSAVAGLVGALEAHLAVAASKRTTVSIESRVKALVASGKITPARKKDFLKYSSADLDTFEKMMGDSKIVPVGEEHQPNDEDETVVAARAVVTLAPKAGKFDPEKVQLTADERAACKRMSPLNTAEFEAKYLADKRARAQSQADMARA